MIEFFWSNQFLKQKKFRDQISITTMDNPKILVAKASD
jgi:hypothetical protein